MSVDSSFEAVDSNNACRQTDNPSLDKFFNDAYLTNTSSQLDFTPPNESGSDALPAVSIESAAEFEAEIASSSAGRPRFAGSLDLVQPNAHEVGQGYLNDCHFVASVQSLANDPVGRVHLKSMIKRVDGPSLRAGAIEDVFEVKFPGAEKPVKVSYSELNPEGAIQTDGATGFREGIDGMWISVLEAAAGKHLGEKLGIDPSEVEFPANNLEKIGDPKFALGLLTGFEANSHFMNAEFSSKQMEDINQWFEERPMLKDLKNAYIAARFGMAYLFEGRSPADADNYIAEAFKSGNHILLSGDNHAYTLMDYEPGAKPGEGVLVLRNPWGRQFAETQHAHRDYSDGTKDGVLKMPIKDAQELFSAMHIVSKG